jgi:hypothetical protein
MRRNDSKFRYTWKIFYRTGCESLSGKRTLLDLLVSVIRIGICDSCDKPVQNMVPAEVYDQGYKDC